MSPEFEGLSLVDLIDLLNEVPEPAPVPLTPQTPGWLVLGGLVLLMLGYVAHRLYRHRRDNAYRRAALSDLARAGNDPAQIADILRRTALAGFPRRDVAGLIGADWLAFLDGSFPGDGFSAGPGQILATAPYRDAPPDPAAADLARSWIATHRREGADPC